MKHSGRTIRNNLERPRTSLACQRILIGGVLLSFFVSGSAVAQTKIAPRTFPFVITRSGAYLLRRNIVLPDSNTTAIQITANDVSLDLGGRVISGPNLCDSSSPPVCPSPGSGIGVDASSATGVTVQNGVIRGMGSHGVSLGDGSQVVNVTASRNGGHGILTGKNADVEKASTVFNAGSGVKALDDSRIINATASGNGGHGLEGGNSLAVEGGIMRGNSQAGIKCGTDGHVALAHTISNATEGIDCGHRLSAESVIAQGNTNRGIRGGNQCNCHDCVASNNDIGIELSSGSGYHHNILGGNTTSNVAGSAVNGGGNVCGAALCP
jgi:hypothetical protein